MKGVGYAWHPKEMLFKRIIKEYLFEYHVTWSVFKSSLRKLWCSFFIKKDFEKYKLAARLVLENKSKPIVEEEENSYKRRNNSLINPFFNPFSMFNSSFSNMMNEIFSMQFS